MGRSPLMSRQEGWAGTETKEDKSNGGKGHGGGRQREGEDAEPDPKGEEAPRPSPAWAPEDGDPCAPTELKQHLFRCTE